MARKRPSSHAAPLPQPIFTEPVFGEGGFLPDPNGFQVPHPSDEAQYKALGGLLNKDVVPFPPSRLAAGDVYPLESAFGPAGPALVERIRGAGRLVFHAVGDTGSSNVRKYKSEIRAADQMASDCRTSQGADRPMFLFQLGDVVYDFGEARYYYDQFYEPFRNYPGPIFAIPGNHDSFLIPGTAAADAPLTTFSRNFCAAHAAVTPEAGSLHRTAMTQPGAYFALDAPFVRVLGLFSNALEDPGLISGEGGRWPGVPDLQLKFLGAQLDRVKKEKYAGALLVAVHHPPFTYAPPPGAGGAGGNHGSSTAMLREIDALCKARGVYPHAFLSAHAHNYQRYTRVVRFGGKDFKVPFVVCGSGGHNVNPLVRGARGQAGPEPAFGTRVDHLDPNPAVETGGLVLEKYDDRNYGYLRVSADARQLRVGFYQALNEGPQQSRFDLVTVDLAGHTTVAN
jgi:hypothetical protein